MGPRIERLASRGPRSVRLSAYKFIDNDNLGFLV